MADDFPQPPPGGHRRDKSKQLARPVVREQDGPPAVECDDALGHTAKDGQQPMSLGVGATYVPVRPDNAAEWQLRAQYSLIFPPGN